MKNVNTIYFKICALTVVLSMILTLSLIGQDADSKPPERPVSNMFESNWMMDHQTVLVPIEGTFEMDIIHRFGTWDNGYDDFFGIYAPSNIKLGFTKTVKANLQLGIGLTKNKNLWDFNIKYAVFQQTRSGSTPLSMTYYGNMAIDTRDGDKFEKGTDRYSYFHQLMLARKFSDKISMQLSGNFTHFNAVNQFYNDNNELLNERNHDHISSTALLRYKLTDITAFIFSYELPITTHELIDPDPGVSFGFEFVTSSHAFQMFVGNYNGIVPQYNSALNENSFGDNKILIGFNITRLWN